MICWRNLYILRLAGDKLLSGTVDLKSDALTIPTASVADSMLPLIFATDRHMFFLGVCSVFKHCKSVAEVDWMSWDDDVSAPDKYLRCLPKLSALNQNMTVKSTVYIVSY